MLSSLLQLIRIKDWLKNFIIFLPIIFSGQLSNYDKYIDLIFAFFIFCFAASFVYILNDIIDVDSDRLHSVKKYKKPIANNKISINFAKIILLIFFILTIVFLFFFKILIFHLIFYILLNIFYSFFLKKIAILDLFILSIGYLVRLDAGSLSVDVKSSFLIIITVFSLAFYIISIKRLTEFNYQTKRRISLIFYSQNLLKKLILFSGSIFIISCFLYFTFINIQLIIIFPLVIYLIYRYYILAIKEGDGEFPIDLVIKNKILFSFSLFFFIIIIINNF